MPPINPIVEGALNFGLKLVNGQKEKWLDYAKEVITDTASRWHDVLADADTLSGLIEAILAFVPIVSDELKQEYRENILGSLADGDDAKTPTVHPDILTAAKAKVEAPEPTGDVSAALDALRARLNKAQG